MRTRHPHAATETTATETRPPGGRSDVVVAVAARPSRTGRHTEARSSVREVVRLLSRAHVDVVDADKSAVIAALNWSEGVSPRRIPDAIIAAVAERSRVDYIATFDEEMSSTTLPVRLL